MTVEEFKDFILFSCVLTINDLDLLESNSNAIHHSLGRFVRNTWGLWETDESKKSDIVKFFNSWGIYHADDMSAIIFQSLRKLLIDRDADIEFEKQVQHYKDFWKKHGFQDGIYKVETSIKVNELKEGEE